MSKTNKQSILFASLVYVLLFLFFITFSAISLWRYKTGQIFFYDYGIFARIIWSLSRFQAPYINHLVLGKIIFLGDHFNPSLALLSPFFWVTSNPVTLIIEQSAAVVLTGYVLYKTVTRMKAPKLTAVSVACSYLLFAGTENALVSDWHAEPTAVLFLALFFYLFTFTSKKILPLIVAVIFLGFKESNAISLSLLLIPLFFTNPSRRKQILGYLLLSVVWFFVTTKFAIPFFSRNYIYYPELPSSPIQVLTSFFSSKEKVQLVLHSLLSYGFLPLFSPLFLVPIVGELLIRFIPSSSRFSNFTLGMHYNVFLGFFLALATAQAVCSMIRYRKAWAKYVAPGIACYLLFASLFVAKKITHPPVVLVTNKLFWREAAAESLFIKQLSRIPATGSVMAQNNILPYLTGRKNEVYLFTKAYKKIKPDILVFDLSQGQNPNNFYGIDSKEVEEARIYMSSNTDYNRIDLPNKDFYVFVKKLR